MIALLAEVTTIDSSNGMLLTAIAALATCVVTLFFLLLRSKDAEIAAYKEILPTAASLIQTVQGLQKIVEKCQICQQNPSRRGGDT